MARNSGRQGSLFMFTNVEVTVRPEIASDGKYVFKNVYFYANCTTFEILQTLMQQPLYAGSVRVNTFYFHWNKIHFLYILACLCSSRAHGTLKSAGTKQMCVQKTVRSPKALWRIFPWKYWSDFWIKLACHFKFHFYFYEQKIKFWT